MERDDLAALFEKHFKSRSQKKRSYRLSKIDRLKFEKMRRNAKSRLLWFSAIMLIAVILTNSLGLALIVFVFWCWFLGDFLYKNDDDFTKDL